MTDPKNPDPKYFTMGTYGWTYKPRCCRKCKKGYTPIRKDQEACLECVPDQVTDIEKKPLHEKPERPRNRPKGSPKPSKETTNLHNCFINKAWRKMLKYRSEQNAPMAVKWETFLQDLRDAYYECPTVEYKTSLFEELKIKHGVE